MASAIPTASGTVTVNAAFLQEIKEVNEELWQLLENIRTICCSANEVHAHAAQLTDMLREMRDQLALHFALEEAFGYFEDPVAIIPSLAREAGCLRGEHRQLFAQASRMADSAERLLYDDNLADFVMRVPAAFSHFDEQLRRHESRENELIMRQFDDLGEGD